MFGFLGPWPAVNEILGSDWLVMRGQGYICEKTPQGSSAARIPSRWKDMTHRWQAVPLCASDMLRGYWASHWLHLSHVRLVAVHLAGLGGKGI